MGHLREDGSGETRKLATHSGRAHKLALDPSAAAAFYSCGEDGVVRALTAWATVDTRFFYQSKLPNHDPAASRFGFRSGCSPWILG